MPSVHPMYHGVSANFVRGETAVTENSEYGSAEEIGFQQTPTFFLLNNSQTIGRWRLALREGVEDFVQLAELMHAGGTDHFIGLVEFPRESVLRGMALTLTSDAAEGFSETHLKSISKLLPVLGLCCYRMAASRTASDILGVYTGAKASTRILSGETQRGMGHSMYAAILLADLENFTGLAELYSPDDIVKFLNERFEIVGKKVELNSGEILKFMGDSVLAMFSADDQDPRDACLAALAAARDIIAANNELNLMRRIDGGPNIGIDIVLHLGEVYYGNVGASDRLDYTIIGRAVNEAARLEKLCGQLGEHLLLSESFSAASLVRCQLLGSFKLRGVAEQANVFKPSSQE